MKLISIELNELNFKYAQLYFKKYNLKNLKKIFKDIIITNSEKSYNLLEPWIQWHTIHTGLEANKHKIFRLGDSVHCNKKQIFEEIEQLGFKIGSISSMNSINRLKKPAFFIPDPWTNTNSDKAFSSKLLTKVLKYTVNNNASGKIGYVNYFYLSLIFLKFVRIKKYIFFVNLFIKSFKKKWYKSIFLDALLHEVHLFFLRKKVDFSTIFFNSGAHIQHHYLLNSLANKNFKKNPAHLVKYNEDPFLDVLLLYDDILGDYFKIKNINLLIATGLTQDIVSKPHFYYRLENHESFLREMGISFKKIEPRMSRDFLICFDTNKNRDVAYQKLSSIFLKKKKLFGILEKRYKSIFATLSYDQEILINDLIFYENKKIKIYEKVVFVALKNGHHSQRGFLYLDKRIKNKFILRENKTIDIKNIKKIIKNYFL